MMTALNPKMVQVSMMLDAAGVDHVFSDNVVSFPKRGWNLVYTQGYYGVWKVDGVTQVSRLYRSAKAMVMWLQDPQVGPRVY